MYANRSYSITKRELLCEGVQAESCSVKESRRLTTAVEDKAVVKMCMRWSSYTRLRISYRQSSVRYEFFFIYSQFFFLL